MNRNKVKQIGYLFYIVITTLIILEFSPYLFSKVLHGKSFSKSQLKSELAEQYNLQNDTEHPNNSDSLTQENTRNILTGKALHPYYGFCSEPGKRINKFGFLGKDPAFEKTDSTVNICIMGGSVAQAVFNDARKNIGNKLTQSKPFRNKEIRITSISLGGFKQPQQLLALTYFLSLGAQYDIVINLDGFNEIVLPFSDNLRQRVYPNYPRSWNMYSKKAVGLNTQVLLARQKMAADDQFKLSKLFSETFLCKSNFGLMVWSILNERKYSAKIMLEKELINSISTSETDYQSNGPDFVFNDTLSFFNEMANAWKQASLLINNLEEGQQFEYFHFLQPNQYFNGSKKLSKEELENAFEHKPFPYKTGVQIGYPFLIKKGKELSAEGVNFTDLTMLFKTEQKTLYVDKCCHFNRSGNIAISEKIAQVIVDHFENLPTSD